MEKVKLNFEQLPCYVDIRKEAKMPVNVKFPFADTMYRYGHGVAMGALAMKIYNSKGEEEYNDQECQMILEWGKTSSPLMYDSLKDIIEKKDEDSKE